MSPSKFQILLIDDSEADAKLFENALKEAAPRVKLYWVATAKEGIEYLRQENRFQDVGPVSLMVCDLNLPAMTGFEFIAQAKADQATRTIPLVVYSGSAAHEDVFRAYALGANSYMVKAMTMDAIIQQLQVLVHYWLETVELPDSRLLD